MAVQWLSALSTETTMSKNSFNGQKVQEICFSTSDGLASQAQCPTHDNMFSARSEVWVGRFNYETMDTAKLLITSITSVHCFHGYKWWSNWHNTAWTLTSAGFFFLKTSMQTSAHMRVPVVHSPSARKCHPLKIRLITTMISTIPWQ